MVCTSLDFLETFALIEIAKNIAGIFRCRMFAAPQSLPFFGCADQCLNEDYVCLPIAEIYFQQSAEEITYLIFYSLINVQKHLRSIF